MQARDADCYYVRGRVKEDLESLADAAGLDLDVVQWPGADYKYRIIANQEQYAQIAGALMFSVDYSNFKNEIARTPGQREKLHTYHNIWGEMLAHQV